MELMVANLWLRRIGMPLVGQQTGHCNSGNPYFHRERQLRILDLLRYRRQYAHTSKVSCYRLGKELMASILYSEIVLQHLVGKPLSLRNICKDLVPVL
jgi:hypothetical protein